MNVCVVASTYPRYQGDGSGRFVQSISEALAEMGHGVHVLAPYHPAVETVASPVSVHHFRYVWPNSLAIMGYAQAMTSDQALRTPAYALSPLYALAEYAALQKLMQRVRFDVIHAHWVIPNAPIAALVARTYRIPLVITLHGSDVFMALQHQLLHPLVRWTFGQAQAVSACSPELRAGAITLGAAPGRVHLVLWGADPAAFDRPQHTAAVAAVRAKWRIGAGQPVILSLGRLVRKKGVRYLIQALPLVVRHYPTVCCLIAGSGPELAELKMLVVTLGLDAHVTFVGNVEWDDVATYMSLSDIFVVPSVHDEAGNSDHLPTTILEAMAAGKPVVATRLGGIPLVIVHGQTGFLVEEKDVRGLADALLCLLASDEARQSFGQAARMRVRMQLNWRQVARTFEALYRYGMSHAA